MSRINVYLYGKLGKTIGKKWSFEVDTPQEALRAINVNTNDEFSDYLVDSAKNKKIPYAIYIGDEQVTKDNRRAMMERNHGNVDVKIIPALSGNVVWWVPYLIYAIIAVATAVVSAMLIKTPDIDLGSGDDSRRKDSYLFSGGPQPAKQGKPVPVGYGRILIYPIVASAEYIYAMEIT